MVRWNHQSYQCGTTKTVTITAQNPDFHQDYNVKIVYDDKPFLTAGAVKRLSDTEATVNFTSSSDGVYYYAVVEKDATEPESIQTEAA